MISILLGSAVSLFLLALIIYNVRSDLEQHKNEDSSPLSDYDNWYGPLYVNSGDTRFFVPKKRAGGYTVNLGNPIGVIVTLISLGLLGWTIYSGL